LGLRGVLRGGGNKARKADGEGQAWNVEHWAFARLLCVMLEWRATPRRDQAVQSEGPVPGSTLVL